MFAFDLPAHTPATPPAIVAASPAASAVVKTLYTSGAVYLAVAPTLRWRASGVCNQLMQEGFFGRPGGGQVDVGDFKCVLLSVEVRPAHGTLVRQSDGSMLYTPTPGFTGRDRIAYLVDAEGRKVRVVQDVIVEKYEPKDSGSVTSEQGAPLMQAWVRGDVAASAVGNRLSSVLMRGEHLLCKHPGFFSTEVRTRGRALILTTDSALYPRP